MRDDHMDWTWSIRSRVLQTLNVFLLVQLVPVFASANDFALNEGAFGLQPLDVTQGQESPLRLIAESLDVRFGVHESEVRARFWLHNTRTDSAVDQLTGFPDISLGEGKHRGDYRMVLEESGQFGIPHTRGPLKDMETFIDGHPVETRWRIGYVHSADTNTGWFAWVPADSLSGRRVGWHVTRIHVPPNDTIVLERRYRTENGNDGLIGEHFFYITQTGGAWAGTIGQLVADVHLVDSLTIDDLDWGPRDWPRTIMKPPRSEWEIVSPTHFRLVWTDFEPARDRGHQHFIVTLGHIDPNR